MRGIFCKFLHIMVLLCGAITLLSARERINFNNDWLFSNELSSKNYHKVTLPHCWDSNPTSTTAKSPIGYYIKEFEVSYSWGRKNLFLRFGAASTHASVLVNGKYVGDHSGGFTSFTFDITPYIKVGEYNSIMVQVTNAPNMKIFPIVSENYTFSGLYRDVELIVTGNEYFTPLNFGSDGVYITQKEVTASNAELIGSILVNGLPYSSLDVELSLFDGENCVAKNRTSVKISNSGEGEIDLPIKISNPKLWNGIESPHLYRVEARLLYRNKEEDFITFNYGIRTFSAPKKSFITLNGAEYPLRGVIRHEDGAYLNYTNHDVELIKEMGCNAVRISSGGAGKELLTLLDKEGIVAWVDLPVSSAALFSGKGYVESYELGENGINQLLEMVYQLYNHPSVAIWGIFSKITSAGDSPLEYIKELNQLIHTHKKDAITAATSIEDGELNQITDIIAWPIYYGFKSGQTSDFTLWAEQITSTFSHLKGGVAEYGSPSKAARAELDKGSENNFSEQSQAHFHTQYLATLAKYPNFWGTFINSMFDYTLINGRNSNTGLVSRDRFIKKESFYLYKALWNKKDSFIEVKQSCNKAIYHSTTTVAAYTNQPSATLYINGKPQTTATTKNGVVEWKSVPLKRGENLIEIKSSTTSAHLTLHRLN